MAESGGGLRFVASPSDVPGHFSSGASAGRCAVASRPLVRGDVAVRAPALAAVLHERCRRRRCDYCFSTGRAPGAAEEANPTMNRCGRCRAAFYCGRVCQERDWRHCHRLECSSRGALEKALEAHGVPGPDALQDALLAGRCVRATAAAAAAAAAAGAPGGRPAGGLLEDLETLEGRLQDVERRQLEAIAAALAAAPGLLPAGAGEDAALDALCRFRNNNFAIVDDLFVAVGAGCYPDGAALNHCCRPNCLLAYEIRAGQAPCQVVRIMEDVAEGDELTHGYVDLALPTWERRGELSEGYGFECGCSRCAASGAAAGGWSALDAQLVGVVASSDGASGGAAACGDGCPLPRAPASAERAAALLRAEILARQAATEEDAAAELSMLQEVCRLRERWLHRRHVEVCAAHAGAHTAAVAAGAWGPAEAHCERLVQHYAEVYPSWHPIAGLQMYTLAEFKERRGAIFEATPWYERSLEILRDTHGEDNAMVAELAQHIRDLAWPCP